LRITHVKRFAGIALFVGFANADDSAEPSAERSDGFFADTFVGVAEELPPFAVANNRPGCTSVRQMGSRNFAGPSAFGFPKTILANHCNRRIVEPLGHRRKRSEHGCNPNVHAFDRRDLVLQLGDHRHRFVNGFV